MRPGQPVRDLRGIIARQVGFEDMAMVNDEAQLHEIDWVSIQGPFQSGTMVNV